MTDKQRYEFSRPIFTKDVTDYLVTLAFVVAAIAFVTPIIVRSIQRIAAMVN